MRRLASSSIVDFVRRRRGWRTLRRGALACLLAVGQWRASGLDFHLNSVVVEEEGIHHDQPYFHNDATTNVYVDLPSNWSRVDGPDTLTLTSVKLSDCMVRLERSSLPARNNDFKEKTVLEQCRRLALSGIPQGATDVRVAEEREMPLPVFQWRDYEFVVSYEFFGQSYQRSVLYIDLNAREQIVAVCLAPKGVFASVHETAFDILRSWQVMPVKN